MLVLIDKIYSVFLCNLQELTPINNCCKPSRISIVGIAIFKLCLAIELIAVKNSYYCYCCIDNLEFIIIINSFLLIFITKLLLFYLLLLHTL